MGPLARRAFWRQFLPKNLGLGPRGFLRRRDGRVAHRRRHRTLAAIEPPWSLLHPNERNILETLTGEARADAFPRLWTAKEAYLKALGLGFARDPTKIAIGLDFSILDEEAAPTILTRGWRRFVLRGEDFIAACVVLG